MEEEKFVAFSFRNIARPDPDQTLPGLILLPVAMKTSPSLGMGYIYIEQMYVHAINNEFCVQKMSHAFRVLKEDFREYYNKKMRMNHRGQWVLSVTFLIRHRYELSWRIEPRVYFTWLDE